jgi:hypothetical protein
MSQRTDGFVEYNAAIVEDFLKLRCGFFALMRSKIGFASDIYWPPASTVHSPEA